MLGENTGARGVRIAFSPAQYCQLTFTDPVPLVGTVYWWFDPFSHVTVPFAAIFMNLNCICVPAGMDALRNQFG